MVRVFGACLMAAFATTEGAELPAPDDAASSPPLKLASLCPDLNEAFASILYPRSAFVRGIRAGEAVVSLRLPTAAAHVER